MARGGAIRTWAHDRSGAAALETALVMPMFLTFVLGVFWLGWGLYCGADVRHAIERAARLYLTTPATTDTQFRSAVAANLTTVSISDVTLTVTKPTVSGATMAQIAWTYSYTLHIPFVSPVLLNFNSQIVAPVRPT
ncbi:TadE/TadG family type IV pilus assembly protein [Caulobacter sp. KR2-114]|uniref:TadE/TadG family type IV pilus assembly protein n=1 Tax=Caulobacter sp. KR2-114 TaxID=3400912 RepID=UPI003C11C07A